MATDSGEKSAPQASGVERPVWNHETAVGSIVPHIAEIFHLLNSKTGHTFNWEWVISDPQRRQALEALEELRTALNIDDGQFSEALSEAFIARERRRLSPPSYEDRLEILRNQLVEQSGLTPEKAQRFIDELEDPDTDEPQTEAV